MHTKLDFPYKYLYDYIVMKSATHPIDLSLILSSQARFRVLQILSLLKSGLGLRELERSTRLGIRSIQVATQALMKERILKKDRAGLFHLNEASPATCRLRGLFEYLRGEELQEKGKALSKRAHQVVRLCDEMRTFVHHHRKLD